MIQRLTQQGPKCFTKGHRLSTPSIQGDEPTSCWISESFSGCQVDVLSAEVLAWFRRTDIYKHTLLTDAEVVDYVQQMMSGRKANEKPTIPPFKIQFISDASDDAQLIPLMFLLFFTASTLRDYWQVAAIVSIANRRSNSVSPVQFQAKP